MIKRIGILIAMFVLLLHGVNMKEAQAIEKIVKEKTVTTAFKQKDAVRIADNVVILFDTSSSMGERYGDGGMTKLEAAKKLLKQRAALFPDVFPELKVGLYSYTPATFSFNKKGYEVFYKMQPLNKEEFLMAVDQLPDKASGITLLQNALHRLDDLLETLSGRTVVFLFTDGSFSDAEFGAENKPAALARKLAEKHNVSFQVISTTDKESQKKIMEKVASINESSRVYPLETLLDRPEVYIGAVFVLEESYIFLTEKREDVVGFKLDHILFDFDKSEIKTEVTEELKAAGKILKENPVSYVVLAGFTDSRGTEEYNLALSRRRVEAVANYLSQEFKIDESRIVTLWYGEAAPVGDNDTEEGRRKNRRVLGLIDNVN
jgi:OOP family OmpA-OmpF porin